MEPLQKAGYHVVAVDQRGIGGSDKTPGAEDGLTLASDLIAIVRALGARKAVIVGHGRGGALAWSAVSMEPDLFAGLVTISSPHPRTLHRVGLHVTFKTWRHVLTSAFTPISGRSLAREKVVRQLLKEWSAPGNDGATSQAGIYTQAINLPGAAKIAISQLRWTWSAQRTPSGRTYLRESANSVRIPVLAIRGEADPLLPDRAWDKDLEFATGPYHRVRVADAGHFVAEEQPDITTKLLLDFLQGIEP
ncbi:alpha/beta fold hydrolase [Trueperella pyogenes]|uniref:alpha/beta fold hydrolase n=1 Tax=Trueperella pyogenes TaxID=1661 RepID=UPI0004688BAA|nr:alpha/beta hydrolase [Trueperella pyogenes]